MTTKPKGTLASIFTRRVDSREPSGSGPKPLTALAALIQARDEENAKKTLHHVSWLPTVMTIRGSVIPSILGPVLTVTIYAIGVAGMRKLWWYPLRLSNSVVPLLSVVVGLLLVFRNGSAYERYSEGRKDFTALLSAARNLSRLAWVQVTLPAVDDKPDGSKGKHAGPRESMTREGLKREKIRFLKLINAFALATKHHLRGEPGTEYEDYRGVLPSDFRRFEIIGGMNAPSTSPSTITNSPEDPPVADRSASPVDIESQQPTGKTRKKKKKTNGHQHVDKLAISVPRDQAGRVVPASPSERSPLLRSPFIRRRTSIDGGDLMSRAYDGSEGSGTSLPLPLVIAHHLSRSLYKFKRDGTLDLAGPAGVNAMQALVQTMVDQLGAMERVVRTPLPPLFTVHLKQCVLLYLFSLPLVLVDDMGWLMVGVVSLVAFTLMGIEGIATEIENPFGLDTNDLPLDLELAELRVELDYMFTRLPEGMDDDDVFAI